MGGGGARGLVVTITVSHHRQLLPHRPLCTHETPCDHLHLVQVPGQLFQVTATVWKPQHRALSERGKQVPKKKSNNTFIRTWGGTKKKRKEKAWRLRHWLGVCVCVFTEVSPKRPQMSHQGLVALFLLTWIKLPAEQPACREAMYFLVKRQPCAPLGRDATRTAAPVKNVSVYRSESHLWLQEGENTKDLTLTCTVATRDGTEPVWVQLFCWEHDDVYNI